MGTWGELCWGARPARRCGWEGGGPSVLDQTECHLQEDFLWKGSLGWKGSWARARQKGFKIEAILARARRAQHSFHPKDPFQRKLCFDWVNFIKAHLFLAFRAFDGEPRQESAVKVRVKQALWAAVFPNCSLDAGKIHAYIKRSFLAIAWTLLARNRLMPANLLRPAQYSQQNRWLNDDIGTNASWGGCCPPVPTGRCGFW